MFGVKALKPLARVGVLTAAASVAIAAMTIIPDLGNPQRVWELFRYPNWSSPLIWDIVIIICYFVFAVVDLWVLAGRRPSTQKAKILRVLAYVGLPMAVLLHSITAWIFGLQISRPWWNTALMAPLFVTSAILSGTALVAIVALAAHRFDRLHVPDETWRAVCGLMAVAIAVDLFLVGSDYVTLLWGNVPRERAALDLVLPGGSWQALFWLEWIVGGLVPFVLLVVPRFRRPPLARRGGLRARARRRVRVPDRAGRRRHGQAAPAPPARNRGRHLQGHADLVPVHGDVSPDLGRVLDRRGSDGAARAHHHRRLSLVAASAFRGVELSDAAAPAAAEAAALLSSWWSRPVEAELAAWAATWGDALEAAEALGLDVRPVEELGDSAGGATEEALLDEYERLFVGPGRTPCPPYESLWLDGGPRLEQGRLMGAASTAVADLYTTLGLDVAAAAHELPDHVAIELEALAVALGTEGADAENAAGALLHEHLAGWLPAFCAAVEREAQQPFYVTLAGVTTAWVERLARDVPAP